ncbi:MAG: NBR1-Ig-like domain-containing protein [Candidatus Aenigmarchaeota archaeon]|nr:NBR1-Ig-like domain-containing protein [Candidatus Aenigmarchaeota archaeon]
MKRPILLLVITTVVLIISCLFENTIGIAQASSTNLKYYGFYGAPVRTGTAEEANLSLFTNIVFIGASCDTSNKTYDTNINFAYNNGHKIILSLTSYYAHNFWESESVWRSCLDKIKTNLGANADKVWSFYLMDEPNTYNYFEFIHHPERVDLIINLSKEYFPNIETFIVFNVAWGGDGGRSVLNNPKLDFIALDPYFFTTDYEASHTNPFACNAANKQSFLDQMNDVFYWVKSGGTIIQYAPCDEPYPDGCTAEQLAEIDRVVHSDSSKKILLIPQNFKCNQYGGGWGISQIPSICQQQWYYDWAKSDSDVVGVIGFTYSTAAAYNAYLSATTMKCLGIGLHVPDMLAQHKAWGKEVMCSIQDPNPFCGVNGVSYRNAEQAKCNGTLTVRPGGSGNNLCDSACNASQSCNGKAPGTGLCNQSCKYQNTTQPPVNNARFVSQSIPTRMAAGKNYNISVTMNNTGTTAWTKASSHRLGIQSGNDSVWVISGAFLNQGEIVNPGSSKEFRFTIIAPSKLGTYVLRWRMLKEGVEWFGDFTPNINITVNGTTPAVNSWNNTLLGLGDSVMRGFPRGSFIAPAALELATNYSFWNLTSVNKGIDGSCLASTCPNPATSAVNRYMNDVVSYNPRFAYVLPNINDIPKGVSASEYTRDARILLEGIKNNALNTTLITSTTTLYITNYDNRTIQSLYDAGLRQIAIDNQIPFMEIQYLMGGNTSLLYDVVHLNYSGNELYMRELVKTINNTKYYVMNKSNFNIYHYCNQKITIANYTFISPTQNCYSNASANWFVIKNLSNIKTTFYVERMDKPTIMNKTGLIPDRTYNLFINSILNTTAITNSYGNLSIVLPEGNSYGVNLSLCSTCNCTAGQKKTCGTNNIGICKLGNQTCVAGQWSNCTGSINPTTEICDNSADENCDGTDPLCSGDTTGDHCVDISDAVLVATNFGLTSGFNVAADINHDSGVNIFDLVTIGKDFGKGSKPGC